MWKFATACRNSVENVQCLSKKAKIATSCRAYYLTQDTITDTHAQRDGRVGEARNAAYWDGRVIKTNIINEQKAYLWQQSNSNECTL